MRIGGGTEREDRLIHLVLAPSWRHRVQSMKVAGQEILTRDEVGLRVKLTALRDTSNGTLWHAAAGRSTRALAD